MKIEKTPFRHNLTQKQIDKLPIREVSQEELYGLMKEFDYNPSQYVEGALDIKLPEGVVGQMDGCLLRLKK